jgi:hypothetical protein
MAPTLHILLPKEHFTRGQTSLENYRRIKRLWLLARHHKSAYVSTLRYALCSIYCAYVHKNYYLLFLFTFLNRALALGRVRKTTAVWIWQVFMWENKNSYDFDGRQAGISCLRWSAGSKTGFKKGVEFAVGVFQCGLYALCLQRQDEANTIFNFLITYVNFSLRTYETQCRLPRRQQSVRII